METKDTQIEGLEEKLIYWRYTPAFAAEVAELLKRQELIDLIPAVKALQEELAASERRYLSAVKGRAAFRTSFMEARETILKLDQQLAKLDQRIVDLGALYMIDGKEKREESNARIATLEAQLAGGDAGSSVSDKDLLVLARSMRLAGAGIDEHELVEYGQAAIRRYKEGATPTPPVSANQPDSGKVPRNDDVDQLLHAVFQVCEATEEIEPKNEFERGRRFEAKHIRNGIGNWFQDTFCGRKFMGEPVLPKRPSAPIAERDK